MSVIRAFLSWLVFLIFASAVHLSFLAATLVAVATVFIFNRLALKEGHILVWGSLITFSLLAVESILEANAVLEQHPFLIASVALALIAWVSLCIRRPFITDFSKLHVSALHWESPIFIKLNKWLTCSWALMFTLLSFIAIAYHLKFVINPYILDVLSAIIIFFNIWFCLWFPNWLQAKSYWRKHKQREDVSNNPYLQGCYAPVSNELSEDNLKITGQIPDDLHGLYLRNGPNPAYPPISYTYPFDGDGMVHSVHIEHGKASYRNRFVMTKGLQAERKVGHALYGGINQPILPDSRLIGSDGDPGPVKNTASVHIIQHAGRYLALYESDVAYEMQQDLSTIGVWQPTGDKPFHVNAHTRLDPRTDELYMFAYLFEPPYLRFYHFDAAGNLMNMIPVDKPHLTMLHDFVLTENYIIFFDCPAVFHMNNIHYGGDVLHWQPELGVKVGIISRKNPSNSVRWFQTDAFFVFHFANAYENNDCIIIDYVRHDALGFGVKQTNEQIAVNLYRTEINLLVDKVHHYQVDDRMVEFPRINDNNSTCEHHYVYTPSAPNKDDKPAQFSQLIKYNRVNNTEEMHDFGQDADVGEAIFAPKPNHKAGDDGYVLVYVYSRAEQSSELVVLDAKQFTDEPLARIHMPQRVPYGLHGSWIPEVDKLI